MVICASPELEELIPQIESELEKTIQERKQLGLSLPQDYYIGISYYGAGNMSAGALFTDAGSIICINTLMLIQDQIEAGEDINKLNEILCYFDTARNILGEENWILPAIQNPEETINKFEQEFPSKEDLLGYKEGFNIKGSGYEDYKRFTIEHAESVKKLLEELMPKIKKGFKKTETHLRHEIDHVDFFNSLIYQDFCFKIAQAEEQYDLYMQQGDVLISPEYGKASIAVLKSMAEIEPLLETKALFFSYVGLNEWDNVNYEEVKKKVHEKFLKCYLEQVYPGEIRDNLISQKWASGEMNLATSISLATRNNEIEITNTEAQIIKQEKVNYKLINEILYKEIPGWKMKFAENAGIAVEAIGQAYKEDPSRLKEANQAKNFQQYIELCKGNKPKN